MPSWTTIDTEHGLRESLLTKGMEELLVLAVVQRIQEL